MPRGQRLYGLPSIGSYVSQLRLRTGSSVNGSMRAVDGSGISSMSEAWMPFQPAMDEPSKACPSSNFSLLKCFTGTVTCCSLPRVSVNRKSTNLTSLSFTSFKTSSAVIAICFSPERVDLVVVGIGREQIPCQFGDGVLPISCARFRAFYPTQMHCIG